MMFKCDLLSRYNQVTKEWQQNADANASTQAALDVLTAMPPRDDSNVNEWKECQGLGWHPILPTHSSTLILVMQWVASEKKVILFELDGSKMNVWQSLPP